MASSRILNDDTLFWGLDRNDILYLSGVYYLFQRIFSLYSKEYLSLVFVGVSLIGLINIRLRFRKKIIRDVVRYYMRVLARGGCLYDPSHS